ncbi:MAG: hypothetical protein KC731_17875 [Myxococcales bacterium]|nr:hypothetical protein [Myxococcales bacterium]
MTDPLSGMAVAFRLAEAGDVPGARAGALTAFPGAGPAGSDLVQRHTGDGVEDYVIFRHAPEEAVVRYELDVAEAAGLRLVAGTLELVDESGAPRLRVAPPFVVDAEGDTRPAELEVEGCAVDRNAAAPWGRAPVAAGADRCLVAIRWSDEGLRYPLTLDPLWTPTANSLVAARRSAAAARLQPDLDESRILIVGGFDGTGAALASAELYHPLSRSFAATGSLSTARGELTATELRTTSLTPAGSPVLVAGGRSSSTGGPITSNVLEVYNADTGQFTPHGLGAAARYAHQATRLQNDDVLISGGVGTNGFPRNAADIYTFNQFTGGTVPDGSLAATAGLMTLERAYHTSTLLPSGRVLLAGGVTNTTFASSSAAIYDPLTGLFSNIVPSGSNQAQMLVGRMRHTATLVPLADPNEALVLITGGTSGNQELGFSAFIDVYRDGTSPSVGFDVQGNPVNMTVARADHRATLRPTGDIVLTGGRSGVSTVNTTSEIARYDAQTGEFSFTALAPTAARQRHVAMAVNAGDTIEAGRAVLVAGGANATTTLASAELLIKTNGETCTIAAECASGHCIEGVCCNDACIGDCYSCALTGTVGTCTPVPDGTTLPPACVNDVTVTNKCDGLGNPIPQTAQDCKPGVCNGAGTACVRVCEQNTDCYSDAYCCFDDDCKAQCAGQGSGGGTGTGGSGGAGGSAGGAGGGTGGSVGGSGGTGGSGAGGSGTGGAGGSGGGDNLGCCVDKKPLGTACADTFECLSPNGTLGENGFCVDDATGLGTKICCSTECSGACQTCDATSGQCLTLGAPGNRVPPKADDSCGVVGTGNCAGLCEGVADQCFFPGNDTLAATPPCVCNDDFSDCSLQEEVCQGDGSATLTPRSCGGFRCADDLTCRTSCEVDDDCLLDFICEAGACVALTGPSCDGKQTVRVPAAPDIDCAPYRCDGTACLTQCASVDDCVPLCDNPDDPTDCQEQVCNLEGACVVPIVGPDVPSCSCRLPGRGDGDPSDAAPWMLIALGAVLARRRRQA